MKPVPTLLLILDGWGIAPPSKGNAVSSANTPNFDAIFARYPNTRLKCMGRDVGLPDGFMGNSEVGHMNIGAGRIVNQDMTRIDMVLEENRLGENRVLLDLMQGAKLAGGRLQLMGLVSDGGVHSHQNHIYALVELAKSRGVEVIIHCFLDGRDTPPTSGAGYVRDLQVFLDKLGWGQIATVTGRYWAMDRDKHFERIEPAYNALVNAQGQEVSDAVAGTKAAYKAGQTDEFIKPCIVSSVDGRIRDGDAVFMFNFRADRSRQLCRTFFEPDFNEFERGPLVRLSGLATMTSYESTFPCPAAFAPRTIEMTLGEVVSGLGLRQLRIAETEKYAHVTYFLNCGREQPFPGEFRELIASPREVATYDLKPSMSANEVTGKLLEKINDYDLIVCNLANLDMVGHTGVIDATKLAVETVDSCVGQLVQAMLKQGGRVLLTADHGNAEEMLDANNNPQTAHSLNYVPLVYIEKGCESASIKEGRLADLAPTILALWGVDKPEQMSGENLVS